MLSFYKELHWDVCCHLMYSSYIQVYSNDLIVAVDTARQGVTVGEDTRPGLILPEGFLGISKTPQG